VNKVKLFEATYDRDYTIYADRFATSFYRKQNPTCSQDYCMMFLPKQRLEIRGGASIDSVSPMMVDFMDGFASNGHSTCPASASLVRISLQTANYSHVHHTPENPTCVTEADVRAPPFARVHTSRALLNPSPRTLLFSVYGVVLSSPLPALAAHAAALGLPPLMLGLFFSRSRVFAKMHTGEIDGKAGVTALNEEFVARASECLAAAAAAHKQSLSGHGGRLSREHGGAAVSLVRDSSDEHATVRYAIAPAALKAAASKLDAATLLHNMRRASRPR
jgi:hypothetical protein